MLLLKGSNSVVKKWHTNHLLLGYGYVAECDLEQLSNLSLHSYAAFLAFCAWF